MFLPWRHRCCLKADSLFLRHLAAEPSNRLLVSLSHWISALLAIDTDPYYAKFSSGSLIQGAKVRASFEALFKWQP
jgi:hypothetical protein